MSGSAIQWWELIKINNVQINDYVDFEIEISKHFEPVNRELTARKALNQLKQMVKLNSVRD